SSACSTDGAGSRSVSGSAGLRAAAAGTCRTWRRQAARRQGSSPPRRARPRASGGGAGGGRSPSSRLSVDVFGFEQRDEGSQDDRDVEPQRPIVDVMDVEFHALEHAVDGGGL